MRNNLRFPGQYFDTETGLHYNYFRDYHAGVGRYIEPDPIGLQGGINLYGHVKNNPINLIDSEGLQPDFQRIAPPRVILFRYFEREMEEFFRTLPKVFYREIRATAVEATGCISCTVTCMIPVFIGELASQGAKYAAKRVAEKFAKEWVKKAIPYVGWISTAYSGYETINCLVDCGI